MLILVEKLNRVLYLLHIVSSRSSPTFIFTIGDKVKILDTISFKLKLKNKITLDSMDTQF